MKNNVLLTDEQIADRALITYPKIILDKLNYDRREGYTSGWKECSVYYRELIEAGVKWKQVVNFCNEQTMNFIQEKRTEQDAIDLGTKILRKLTELIEKE